MTDGTQMNPGDKLIQLLFIKKDHQEVAKMIKKMWYLRKRMRDDLKPPEKQQRQRWFMSSTLSNGYWSRSMCTHPISMGFLLLIKRSTQHMDRGKIIDREERHESVDR